MYKKTSLIVLALCINLFLAAQSIIPDCHKKIIDIAPFGTAYQSSTHTTGTASFALDGNQEGSWLEQNVSRTLHETNPWWEIDLGDVYSLDQLSIWYPSDVYGEGGLQDYFILISKSPFESTYLASELASSAVDNIHVQSAFPSETSIPLNFKSGQYLRIQMAGEGELALSEIGISGTCRENCVNKVDDDYDRAIDCEDSDCHPLIYNVTHEHPSCGICADGAIHIQAFGGPMMYSIDGGLSFQNSNHFHHLLLGEYHIVVQNFYCIVEYPENPVVLAAPLGRGHGNCENGGFENGDFEHWESASGKWDNPGWADDFMNSGAGNGAFTILSSGSDPFAPIVIPFSGTYTAQLGDRRNGSGIDKLTYSLTVDQQNAEFSFNYAVVLEDPNHPDVNQPFFRYEIFTLDNGDRNTLDFLQVFSDEDDPFFDETDTEGIAYKGWTCVNLNLLDFVEEGTEVFVEFVVADCEPGDHFGYAYIDGLCNSEEDNTPVVELELKDIYCQNQKIIANASESYGFNQFYWEICLLDDNGNIINCEATPKAIGAVVPIFDVGAFYLGKTGNLPCDHNYLVKLTLENDCVGPVKTERTINYFCDENTVAYLDILACAQLEVQMQGENNCTNCDITWSPSNFLDDPEALFPTIEQDNVNSFQLDYIINATNSVGCIYEDTVSILQIEEAELVMDLVDYDHCNYTLRAIFKSPIPVSNSLIQVTFDNVVLITSFSWVLVSGEGTKRTHIYELQGELVDKHNPRSYLVTVNFDIPPTAIQLGDCQIQKLFEPEVDNTYFGNMVFTVANGFTPDADGVNDTVEPIFNVHGTNGWPTWARFVIMGRWGAKVKVHDKDMKFPIDGSISQQLIRDSIGWDGFFKGNPAVSETYAWFLWIENCDHPINCNCAKESDLNSSGDIIGCSNVCGYAGTVTLIR